MANRDNGARAPSSDTADISRRGTEMSATGALERTRAMVSDCRAELADLRVVVKSARSHREKSMDLLTIANTAVLALEDGMYVCSNDMTRERAVQSVAARLQIAIDRAEAVVKVYGQMGAMGKFMNKMMAPSAVTDKFQDSCNELRNLNNEAIRLCSQGSANIPPTRDSGNSADLHIATRAASHQQTAFPPSSRATSIAPTSPLPPGREPSQSASENKSPSTAGPFSDASATLQFQPSGIDTTSSEAMTGAPSGRSNSAGLSPTKRPTSGGPDVPSLPLWRPSRTETPKALALAPSLNGEHGGRVWLYVSKMFGSDAMMMYDLPSGAKSGVKAARAEGPVSCMHVDFRGILWTGHRSGAVIPWDQYKLEQLCNSARPSSSAVTALTVDESGAVWAGTDRGDVWRLVLEEQRAGDGGAVLDLYLREGGRLMHTGTNKADKTVAAPGGMVVNAMAKEKAHEGAVSAIVAAAGKVWTSGGSAAFICMREWKQNGAFVYKHLLKQTGACTAMMLVSQMVRVMSQDPMSIAASGFGSTAPSVGSPGSMLPGSTDVPQPWQLLTGHAGGMIQIWGVVSHLLRPLMRIGQQAPPVTGLALCEPLGLVCSAHSDGRVVFRALPHPGDPAMLATHLVQKEVKFVDDRTTTFKMTGDIKVSDFAIACLDGGPIGVVTAAFDGSVSFWPDASLRSVATEAGITSLPPPGTNPMQWPFRKLDARTVQLAMQAPAQEAAGPQGPAPNHSNFSQDAARWLIDYRDLQVKRDIGSGAFGSVKLATWNETEVAVKLLTSLEQLGVTDIASVIGADGKVNLTGPAGEAMKTLEREVSLMMGMRHPNVILFLGVTTNPPAVVTEYCSRGSLYDLLKEAHDNETLARQLDWPRRLTIALDAAKGMLYLHSHKPPIIHRDLKSPNLLIDRHWRAKVTDFNLSRLSEAPSVASSVVANNPRWSAPEIVTSHQFSTAGDVFAFGHILWELLTWELPFAAMKPFQMIVYIGSQGGRPEIPPPGSPLIRGGTFPGYDDYLALMRACWAENPADRPAFDQVIASLRAIAGKMAEEARGQAQASAAAAAALQAAAADEPEQQQAPEPSFAPVATNNAEATNGGGGGGGGGAIPPPVLSPFDMPTAGAAGGPPPPMRSPFDDGPRPPVPSPFDSPMMTGPPPPMPSPFDEGNSATVGPTRPATTSPHGYGEGGPFAGPPRNSPVVDSVTDTADGRISSAGRSGLSARFSSKPYTNSSNSSGAGSFLRSFRKSLRRSRGDAEEGGAGNGTSTPSTPPVPEESAAEAVAAAESR